MLRYKGSLKYYFRKDSFEFLSSSYLACKVHIYNKAYFMECGEESTTFISFPHFLFEPLRQIRQVHTFLVRTHGPCADYEHKGQPPLHLGAWQLFWN